MSWWLGTPAEWNVYKSLLKLGKKQGIDFSYQSSLMGGRPDMGGSVLDFYLPTLNLAINVQEDDELQRTQLRSMGIRLEFISEEEAIGNPDYYVSEAIG